MSRLRKPKARNQGGAWERIWSRMTGTPRRRSAVCKPRRLVLDQLEERTLLSISPGGTTDQLINQGLLNIPSITPTQVNSTGFATAMVAGKSVATDNNGDFVITWSQNDQVYDSSGHLVYASNGYPMTDDNVYARYYTQEMQRIDVPVGTTGFNLQYNGNEVQELTFSAGTPPYGGTLNPIAGRFQLSFGGNVTPSTYFNENTFAGQPVTSLLNNTITANAASMVVASPGKYPEPGLYPNDSAFTVAVGNEHIRVTNVAANGTWTIQRGVDGTTAAAHNSGATVTLVSAVDPAAAIQQSLQSLGARWPTSPCRRSTPTIIPSTLAPHPAANRSHCCN